MIILNDSKYCKVSFNNEEELEDVVKANFEYLFGPASMYLPKAKIKTGDKIGTIPDGFAIDIDSKKWYIVEAEIGIHNVWSHISPQVTKQILASLQPETKSKLMELAIEQYNRDNSVKEIFEDAKIKEIDVRKVLGDILATNPIIGIPIDHISKDLEDWSSTQRFEVKLWKITKYSKIGSPKDIIFEFPEEFKPDFDSNIDSLTVSRPSDKLGRVVGDITIKDLIDNKLINVGDELVHEYGPRGMKKKKYAGVVQEDGSLKVLDQLYSSPSYAALACLQDAGSKRKTVNGWTSWMTKDGRILDGLRIVLKDTSQKE